VRWNLLLANDELSNRSLPHGTAVPRQMIELAPNFASDKEEFSIFALLASVLG
jgi:hypothetical protein